MVEGAQESAGQDLQSCRILVSQILGDYTRQVSRLMNTLRWVFPIDGTAKDRGLPARPGRMELLI